MTLRPKLMVGLGNPSAQYEKTRHNAGFWFIEAAARQYGASFRSEPVFQGDLARFEYAGRPILLLKPATYMNHSGRAVGSVARYYKIEAGDILVVHDELEFEPGMVRLKVGGGHGGHNGIKDILAHMGTADFPRLRIGIGRPTDRSQVSHYVLNPPGRMEGEQISVGMSRALGYLADIMDGNIQKVMNNLNAR